MTPQDGGMGAIIYHEQAYLPVPYPGTETARGDAPDGDDEPGTALWLYVPNPICGPAPAMPERFSQLRLPVDPKPPLDLSASDGSIQLEHDQITNPDLSKLGRGQGLLAHDDQTTALMIADRPKPEPTRPVLPVGKDGLTEYERLYGRGRKAPVWNGEIGRLVEYTPAALHADTVAEATKHEATPLLKIARVGGSTPTSSRCISPLSSRSKK